MRLWLGCFIWLGTAACAMAATLPLIAPPQDFGLLQPSANHFYGSSGGNPRWAIASWDIPGGNLPQFSKHMSAGVTVLSTVAPESGVRIEQTGTGKTAYALSQNGAALPCSNAAGQPRESDLFASVNGDNVTPPERSGMLLTGADAPALSAMTQLLATATVTYHYGDAAPRRVCPVAQGSPIIALILSDTALHQTLFYQLSLGHVCGPQPASRTQLCEAVSTHPAINFFYRKNPFGADDLLPLYGQPYFTNGETRSLRLNLLPHLIQIIKSGPPGMDREPAHWTVTGYYNGQIIFGGITMATTWRGVALDAVTP